LLSRFPPARYRELKRGGRGRNHDSSLLEAKIVETEKVLNGLIRALRDD
jgi:hypothetical protein